MLGIDESIVRETIHKHRAEPSYRPIPIVQDATLAQVAAVTAHRLDTELPDVIVERVPTRRYPESMAAHLFGYVAPGDRGAAGRATATSRATWWGRPGFEKVYNKVLMGAGRRPARRRQQPGPRDPDARGSAARPRGGASS